MEMGSLNDKLNFHKSPRQYNQIIEIKFEGMAILQKLVFKLI